MNDHAFNLVIGVLALVGAATSILGYYHSRLPSQRMKKFDEIFGHSKKLFSQASERGSITALRQSSINATITQLEELSRAARERVYTSSLGLSAYVMSHELSKEINTLIRKAEELRLSITTSTQPSQQSTWWHHDPNWARQSPQRARFLPFNNSLVPTTLTDRGGHAINDIELTGNEVNAINIDDDDEITSTQQPQRGAWRRHGPNWAWHSPQRTFFLPLANSLVPTTLADRAGCAINNIEPTDNEFNAIDMDYDDEAQEAREPDVIVSDVEVAAPPWVVTFVRLIIAVLIGGSVVFGMSVLY